MQYLGFIWCGVMVENLEASVSFYRDVMGLKLLGKGEDWVHFDAGGGALFELMSGGKAAPSPKSTAQQPLVPGMRVDDLYRAVAELKQKGIEFIGEIGEFENTRWARFSDPEGNLLEIKEIQEA
jgi:predicted enzyme related to lactoylglutathione lyase